jgi:hypothetical protein
MSTPSGKPFNPFDLSPYAPKRARERPAQERSEERLALDEAALALSLAPCPPEPAAADEPHDDPERSDQARAAAAADTQDVPAAGRSEPGMVRDNDLQRLESSLQWLQREGKVDRLPRAVQLPHVSGLRPVAGEDSRPRDEQFINGIRVPRSLAPERLRPPPPMRARGDNLRGPLRVLLAGVIAAPIAYYFAMGTLVPSSEPTRETELASFASKIVASTEFPIPKDELRPGEAEDYNSMISARNRILPQPVSAPSATSSRGDALPRSPAPDADPAPPASPAVRELDPDAIKLLMRQGEQFIAAGDLVTARQVFRRAAEAGDAAAALAMGATFDPSFLAKLGMRGTGADVDKAQSWYETAKTFGSPDAPRRLEMLATR